MQNFGWITVQGQLKKRPSGICTYSAIYLGSMPEKAVYEDLMSNASKQRRKHWGSPSTSSDLVVGGGIVPNVIRPAEYSYGAMVISSYWNSKKHPSEGFARLPIDDEIDTSSLFNRLRTEAIADWRNNQRGGMPLGYVAVREFVLLPRQAITRDCTA